MVGMQPLPASRRDTILRAVVPVFGRFGFRKTSIEELAEAAGLSKQGLYLHFSGKEEIFVAAMQLYLDDGLALVEEALGRPGIPLADRLAGAMDAWFGRHLATFTPAAFDVIEAGDRLSPQAIEGYKAAFKSRIEQALAQSAEFAASGNVCTAGELAEVLFGFGLSWKQAEAGRTEFAERMRLCIRACCQLRDR